MIAPPRVVYRARMAKIPDSHIGILKTTAYAHLATLMADGSPQVSPVWIDHKDGLILVNSARGRVKDKNIDRDPRVAVSVTDPENPYRGLMIRGRVVRATQEGADEHIDELAHRYVGKAYPFRQPGEVRVIYYVEPTSVGLLG
jgi:PPOX class probable F420-dependent enzyme